MEHRWNCSKANLKRRIYRLKIWMQVWIVWSDFMKRRRSSNASTINWWQTIKANKMNSKNSTINCAKPKHRLMYLRWRCLGCAQMSIDILVSSMLWVWSCKTNGQGLWNCRTFVNIHKNRRNPWRRSIVQKWIVFAINGQIWRHRWITYVEKMSKCRNTMKKLPGRMNKWNKIVND
jgi:hypothetical protein